MTLYDAFLGIVISIGAAIIIVAFVGLFIGCLLATITDRWEEHNGD